MSEVSIIGLDIAKSVFQVHGADASGRAVLRKKVGRAKLLPFFASQPPCQVVMEACGGAHHWARELAKLGHDVRLNRTGLCKAVRKAPEERCRGCRSYLRGGTAPQHAVRASEDGSAAGGSAGVPGA